MIWPDISGKFPVLALENPEKPGRQS